MSDGRVTGHEPEFRALFAQEAAKRLGAMDANARALPDAEAVEELLRDAHTLKGSAAVVGYEEIARLLQAVELTLTQATRGGLELTPEAIAEIAADIARVPALMELA